MTTNMTKILEELAEYTAKSGFSVSSDHSSGETVILIESEDDCIVLEYKDKTGFLNAARDYQGAGVSVEIAMLAAAKPWVESLS